MRPSDALAYRRVSRELAEEQLRRRGKPTVSELKADQELLHQYSLHTFMRDLPMKNVYFVTGDMTALARAASASVPDLKRTETTLASPHGFMIYEHSIGESVGHMEPGPNKHWMLEEGHSTLDADGRVRTPLHGFAWKVVAEAATLAPALVLAPMGWVRSDTLYPIDWTTAPMGTPVRDGDGITFGDDLKGDDLEKRFWVTHILMQQTLAWNEIVHADRAERRRCARAGLPASNIKVVKVRRVEKSPEQDADALVAWTHRWVVSGHWRQQFYPSTKEHRPVWISPHVKGPTDKPLIVKEKVTAWVR